ncbi:MAG TPA: 3'-5' exonuclease [Candidatus Limiplasma sp.]|nr:3'-5' exonuclease [Candidatus Limiplasma sp.]HRX07537.1 3'-5' exonuclease [Candidatus Limiplasma sp.]
MHYIVMDLEWNQPVSFQSSAYKQIGEKLLFEIIQIGAVKLDKRFRIVDETDILISPTYYKRLHPYVRRMTKLSQEELAGKPAFSEAMTQFIQFCGKDAVLCTWGADDVSVLKQNADCFSFEGELPKAYNIQRYFAEVFKLGNSQKALKSAMEELHIEEEENRAFHHALHDAYYTALVLQKLPDPKKVLEYEQEPRKFGHTPSQRRFRVTHTVPAVAAGLKHKDVIAPACPTCGQPAALTTELIPQAPGRYIALCKCKKHGPFLLKLRFAPLKSKQVGMNLSLSPASRQTRAYLHTKELQYQYRRKNGYAFPDPEDLSEAYSSSMPFDDK